MSSPSHDGDENCTICHKPHPWPDGTMPRHPFNASPEFQQKRKPEDVEIRQQVSWPFDPVLRQALITKGILTPEDLTQAEAQIRAVTAQWEATNDAGRTVSRS